MQIAIVDDDELFCAVLESYLPACGVKDYLIYNDGPPVLAALETQPEAAWPELILLDINLPQMTGWEILAELQKKAPKIQICLLIAQRNDADRQRALRHPQVSYILEKPLQIQSLKQLITSLLKT